VEFQKFYRGCASHRSGNPQVTPQITTGRVSPVVSFTNGSCSQKPAMDGLPEYMSLRWAMSWARETNKHTRLSIIGQGCESTRHSDAPQWVLQARKAQGAAGCPVVSDREAGFTP